MDFNLGRLLDEIRGLRFWDNTIIIVTSDVAQTSGEFWDISSDGSFLNEVLTRVPLLIRDPRAPKSWGRPSSGRVKLVDLTTTMYDIMGVGVPANGPGTTLLR